MKGMFMKNHYDYLVVGAGITAAVFAHEAALAGKSCLVIDRRPPYRGQYLHEGRRRHQRSRVRRSYLPHLHQARGDYVNRFAEFNNYVNSPVAVYKDELYNMPFNMNTFSKMWASARPPRRRPSSRNRRRRARWREPRQPGGAGAFPGRARYLREAGEGLQRRSSGVATARNCRHPSSVVFPCASRMTTTTSTIVGRASPMGGYTAMVERMFGDMEILRHRVQRSSSPSTRASRIA